MSFGGGSRLPTRRKSNDLSSLNLSAVSSTIALARASVRSHNNPVSLVNPSRPFTPALDRRTAPWGAERVPDTSRGNRGSKELSSEGGQHTNRGDRVFDLSLPAQQAHWPVFNTEEDWRMQTPRQTPRQPSSRSSKENKEKKSRSSFSSSGSSSRRANKSANTTHHSSTQISVPIKKTPADGGGASKSSSKKGSSKQGFAIPLPINQISQVTQGNASGSRSSRSRPTSARTKRRSAFPNAQAGSVIDKISALKHRHDEWLAKRTEGKAKGEEEGGMLQDDPSLQRLVKDLYETLKLVELGSDLVILAEVVLQLPLCSPHKLVHRCCERLFGLSQQSSNDQLLGTLAEQLVNVTTRPTACGYKALSYVLGVVRNLSLEESGQLLLGQRGCVQALLSLTREEEAEAMGENEGGSSSSSSSSQRCKMLTEVCGVLRNMAAHPANDAHFRAFRGALAGEEEAGEGDAVDSLCALLQRHPAQPALMLNAVRALSKLSLLEGCIDMLSKPSVMQLLFNLLQEHHSKLAFCIRICFILGNLTVNSDTARLFLYSNCDAVRLLLENLVRTSERDIKIQQYMRRKAKRPDAQLSEELEAEREKAFKKALLMEKEINEMLVKLIRLLANLAINAGIGTLMAQEPEALALVKLLQRKSSKQLDQREELVLNIIGAITNLSFYHNPGGSGGEEVGEEREDAEEPLATFVLFQGGREALACLVPYLFSENHEVVSETVRALGNFSRDPSVRQAMKESRVDETLVVLLEHADIRVVFGVCGVLLNLAACGHTRGIFTADGCECVDKLCGVLARFGLAEPTVTDVVLKTFLNLLSAGDGGDGEGGAGEENKENEGAVEVPQQLLVSLHSIVEELRSGLQGQKNKLEEELLEDENEGNIPMLEEAAEMESLLQVGSHLLEVLELVLAHHTADVGGEASQQGDSAEDNVL